MMNTKKIVNISIYGTLILAVISLVMDFFYVSHLPVSVDIIRINHMVFRVMSGLFIMSVLYKTMNLNLFKGPSIVNHFFVIFPAILISLNNFPFSAYISGRTTWDEPFYRGFLFLGESLTIGFFEEIIFRGVLLNVLVNLWSSKKHGLTQAVMLSSLVFGLAHLINFNQINFDQIIMQIGYSLLLGILWSVIYLKTKSLWVVMILHATYNFFGLILFEMGSVTNRFDTFTIIITSIISIFVAIHTIVILISLNSNEQHQNLMSK